jgi:hypothetical protein
LISTCFNNIRSKKQKFLYLVSEFFGGGKIFASW